MLGSGIISGMATIITIIVFISGKNLPDFITTYFHPQSASTEKKEVLHSKVTMSETAYRKELQQSIASEMCIFFCYYDDYNGNGDCEMFGFVTKKDDADYNELCYLIRSALESEKNYLIRKLTLLTECIDDICLVEGHYPAWEFMRESPLREKMECVYEKMYGKKAIIQTIHAGLECGIIADKLPGLDCISFGPDIQYIHTTREKLSISSTKRVWEYLIALLKEI